MKVFLPALVAVAVAACSPDRPPAEPAAPAPGPVIDGHTSQVSLDWSGVYEGLLACADCPGIHTRLTLNPDTSYELVTRRLVRDAESSVARGRFGWEPDGNTIALDAAGDGQRFAVGEGRLLRLEPGQARADWSSAATVLSQLPPPAAPRDLSAMLGDHRWSLVNATDAGNRRIDALFPDPRRAFAFSFAGSGLQVQGGCNGLRAEFRLGADNRLSVTGAAGTLMACDPPLMAADAALGPLLAEPLEPVIVQGSQPTLVLLTRTGEALVLTGELTPEAQFGAPTTIFLEIGPETVICESSARADGRCLEVREISFDEQGLKVGTPGDWQPLGAEIRGYQHEPGVRNILRLKRFQPPPAPDGTSAPVYVLDLMVESEVVRP